MLCVRIRPIFRTYFTSSSKPTTSLLKEPNVYCFQQNNKMGSASEQPCLSFGAIADVQHADADNGVNFTKTSVRYYRTSLQMLDKAVNSWNSDKLRKPQFVLQLGDAIDGLNKRLGISEKSLAAFLQSCAGFDGQIYHIWGNHEYYNFTREQLLQSDLYSGNDKYCKPVKGKVYYSCIPHAKLRILALDCYEISWLASPKYSDEYNMASNFMKCNKNEAKNSSDGLQGDMRRFVEFNGALTVEQLNWIEENLNEARALKQNVILIGHCGVFSQATSNRCLCWNAPELLQLIQDYGDCVLAYLSGHDHSGGLAYDEKHILHMAFHGVLENGEDSDFGTFYMYSDRLELKGNGRVPSLQLPLKFKLETS